MDFVVNVVALTAAIFLGSIAVDWWRKNNR